MLRQRLPVWGGDVISVSIKEFVQKVSHAVVASSDSSGVPHLAATAAVSVPDPSHLLFEAWFCTTTLRNVKENPQVAVAVADTGSGRGFQFLGRVEKSEETALLDGFVEDEPAGMPQVQSRFTVLVESVMEFTAGAHTDQPLG